MSGSPNMEGACEYMDSRKGVVLKFRGWAGGLVTPNRKQNCGLWNIMQTWTDYLADSC